MLRVSVVQFFWYNANSRAPQRAQIERCGAGGPLRRIEGPVSGDRGAVRRLDGGECRIIEDAADRCVAELLGEFVRGEIELRRIRENWQLTVR